MRGSKRQPVVAWVLGAVLLFALAGLIYTPYAPSAQIAREAALSGPSASHWLGVDALGRDLFSRLWRGTGNTVVMALGAVAGS
ncbi:MAG: ABC transporter permease, partial [Verrucomicrobiota bacterium]